MIQPTYQDLKAGLQHMVVKDPTGMQIQTAPLPPHQGQSRSMLFDRRQCEWIAAHMIEWLVLNGYDVHAYADQILKGAEQPGAGGVSPTVANYGQPGPVGTPLGSPQVQQAQQGQSPSAQSTQGIPLVAADPRGGPVQPPAGPDRGMNIPMTAFAGDMK